MKVLFNGQSLLEPAAGIKTYSLELLRAMKSVDPSVEITLCIGHRLRACPEQLDSFSTTGARPGPERSDRLVRRLVPDPIKSASRTLILRSQVARLPDHVYHEPNHLLERWPQPSVVTVHDLTCLTSPEFHPPKRIALFREQLSASIKRAKAVITVSETVRTAVLNTFNVSPDRVQAIPLGVSLEEVAPSREQEILKRLSISGTYFLCVGAIEPRKNLGLVARALRQLHRGADHRVPVVHVGPTGWNNSAERVLINSFEDGEWRQLSVVDGDTLSTLYRNAVCLIFPSHDEGFGLPPLEAMACGTPVIVSDIPVHHEVLGPAALYTDPRSVDSLLELMKRVLDDQALRTRLSMLGLERAISYRWKDTAERTLIVYKFALES